MDAPTFINTSLRDLHAGLRTELESVSQEELLAIPAAGANSIGFLFWHFIRTEDQVLHRQVAKTEPVWVEERWHECFGLDADAIGTGFSTEQVASFRPDQADLMAYYEAVWSRVPDIVGRISPDDLDIAPNSERPRATLGRTIANIVVGHGVWHIGDIRYTKDLMGKPFSV